MTTRARADTLYWLLVVILFAAQAVYTIAGLERLWYEELAEGIRNPFWLDHREVYDGTSSNVAWYGLVLLVNKAFGFTPYAAKYVHLALHVPFLLATAVLLERWLGAGRAWLPLLAIGLSPTALYFNNLGTSYGIDLTLCPPVVWLITLAADGVRSDRSRAAVQIAIGCLAMIACLAFPTFLIYLGPLLVFHLWMNRGASSAALAKSVVWMTAGFAGVFVVALVYLRADSVFLSDPAANGAGVFRGGGGQIAVDALDRSRAIAQVFHDLFLRGSSYNFALPDVEFSGILGFAAVWGVVLGAIVAGWKWKGSRVPLLLAGLLCVLSILVPSLARNVPGLRRSTGVLAGTYIVVACVWAIPVFHGHLSRVLVWIGRGACVLLVAHHVAAYMPNLRYLQDETRRMTDPWFYRFGPPRESVRVWAEEWVLKQKPLTCPAGSACRYGEIYAAVAGYLKWNGLGEPPVLAIDPRSGEVIRLDTRVWSTHALPH